MKAIFLSLFFIASAYADVSIQDCLDDALTFANHTRPVAPLAECANVVNAQPDKVVASSGLYRAYAKDHMLYLDKQVDPEDEGNGVAQRTLLAGDQTELNDIEKVFIDVAGNRLFVIQSTSTTKDLLVFKLDFLGNVTPLNRMRSTTLLTGATSVKMSGDKEIEVVNAQGSWLINANAETRSSRSLQVPVSIKAK